ncbi:MAG: hypothetical protein EOP48_14750, partial [Sphingobacteriales bacterium]
IIRNDNTILTDWKAPGDFKKSGDGKYVYPYLGKIAFKKDQFILIEIYNINNYSDRDALIVDWRPARKLEMNAVISYESRKYSSLLSISLGNDQRSATNRINFLKTDTLSDVRFHLGDSLVRMEFISLNLRTPYNYRMILRKTISNRTESMDIGEFNEKFYLYKKFWDEPGHYSVDFIPVLIKHGGSKKNYLLSKKFTYQFTVLPPLNSAKLFSSRELALILVIVTAIGGALLAVIVSRVKRTGSKKLSREQQQKEIAKSRLNGIRAQLNPHFLFNALAGIQNLMNKNDMDTANRYLGKFARLTRNVLDNQEMVTIKDEVALLEDYLQMEQLRFGFKYAITTEKGLDINNIEIPSMLLQPLVENSVKHGFDGKADGNILVKFNFVETDLILSVADNGKGFDPGMKYSGLGLKLTENRISLLRDIYKENEIDLIITSNDNGTKIIIRLKHWL